MKPQRLSCQFNNIHCFKFFDYKFAAFDRKDCLLKTSLDSSVKNETTAYSKGGAMSPQKNAPEPQTVYL